MNRLSFLFLLVATLSLIIGMAWGIAMSATQDHTLSPAHGHLNLIGWVTMAIYGIFYQFVPAAAATRLAKAHFTLALVGLLFIVPGIAIVLLTGSDLLAKLGSILSLLSVIVFGIVVVRSARPAAV